MNFDDDDVAEDYESDMADPDEKRILDNSGWSARTRFVALFSFQAKGWGAMGVFLLVLVGFTI